MGVLIKDYEMPENCIECPMQFEQGKPEWCPLVEVTE